MRGTARAGARPVRGSSTGTGTQLVAALQPVLEWSRTWNQELTAADEDEPRASG